jgi:hypothetical protein
MIWIHTPTLTYEFISSLSYEFISFVNDMNSCVRRNMDSVAICMFNMDNFLLNQKGLVLMSILPKKIVQHAYCASQHAYCDWIHIASNTYTYLLYEFIYYFNDMNSYFLFIHHVNSYIPVNPHHTDYFTNGIVYSSVNNLLCLTSDLNSWTSNFVMTHGDQSIDVSSAAQGTLSSSPSGIYPHQIIQYPCTKYYVDFFWYWC